MNTLMKTLLFAALSLAGLAAFASSAQAGCVNQVLVGYDRFGHPVYQQVYTPSYVQPRQVYYYQAPVYAAPRYQAPCYQAPVRYQSSGYDRNCDSGRSYSRPRFSVSFGF